MPISNETLKAMIQDFQGFNLTDAELELIRPEIDNYMAPWRACESWTCLT